MTLHPDETPTDRSVQIHSGNFTGPPGILRPGIEQSIPVYANSGSNLGKIDFSLFTWVSSEAPVPDSYWNELEVMVKPAEIDPATWSNIWASMRAKMGTTWKEYLAFLS